MIPLSDKFIVLNGHSIDSIYQNHFVVGIWLFFLKLWLRCLGINSSDIVFTLDDFYLEDLRLVEILNRHGITKIIIFYCPGVFELEKPAVIFKNEKVKNVDIATESHIYEIQRRFPTVEFGVHGWRHESYRELDLVSIKPLAESQIKAHCSIFKEPPKYFAFPYGKASMLAINSMSDYFKYVFLSDNTSDITFGFSLKESKIINRRHLELGGSLTKFILITATDKLKQWKRELKKEIK